MPHLFPRVSCCLALVAGATAFISLPAPEDNCVHPFGLHTKAQLVYAIQDSKGKQTGEIIRQAVRAGSETNKKGTLTTATLLLKSGIYDHRHRLVRQQDLTYACQRDTTFTDGLAELPPDALRRFQGRLLEYQPVRLAWPNAPTVGTTLPSGGVQIAVRSSAVDIAQVNVLLTNRRVVSGPAAITTPAGTFQCYKVEAERDLTTRAHVDMALRKVGREVTYYAPEIGIIRTERYERDKLTEVLVLTKRENGATPE